MSREKREVEEGAWNLIQNSLLLHLSDHMKENGSIKKEDLEPIWSDWCEKTAKRITLTPFKF